MALIGKECNSIGYELLPISCIAKQRYIYYLEQVLRTTNLVIKALSIQF